MPSATQFSGKKVLVTGASGLVGCWLIKALRKDGAHVVAVVRDFDPQSEFIRTGEYKFGSIVTGDIADYGTIERAISEHETSVVIHLAAQAIVGLAHRSPLLTFESNVRGTYNVLEACRTHRQFVKAVVIASSDKAYGHSPTLPYVETMRLAGTQPYEVSKSCADLIAQSYAVTYGMPIAIGRCGNIYGGGDLNWSRLIPSTIRSLLSNENPVLRSDGTHVRDYIYVEDVATAYIAMTRSLLAGESRGQAYNFSPEAPYTVTEIVAAIQRVMRAEHLSPVILNTAEGEIHSQYLDSSKARRELRWKPEFDLDSGLAETVRWYRAFLQHDVGAAV